MLRALTVCQPWAWAILEPFTRYENRTWGTNYRGPLLIHAGRSTAWLEHGRREIEGVGIPVPGRFVMDAIVGQAELTAIVEPQDLPEPDLFATGPRCWRLDRPRKLVEPIPYRGGQGIFGVPERALAGARWEPQCRVCGCTEGFACPGGCVWANREKDLCTRCASADGELPAAGTRRIRSQCPCGQRVTAVLVPGERPQFFVVAGGASMRVTACPVCGRDWSRLSAEEIRGSWRS